MLERSEVEGYDAFCKIIGELEKKEENVYVFFSGSKGPDGKSWCPDCIEAWPVIEEVLQGKKDIYFLYVSVGDRAYWKDPACPFRTDKRLKLKSVPTLLKWGHPERIEDAECSKADLVEMVLEES